MSQACKAALADGCLEVPWIEEAAAGTGVNFPYQRLPGASGPGGLAGVNYLGRPATTILAGGGGCWRRPKTEPLSKVVPAQN